MVTKALWGSSGRLRWTWLRPMKRGGSDEYEAAMSAAVVRVVIPAGDIQRATSFYGRVLHQPGRHISAEAHEFSCGGVMLECRVMEGAAPHAGGIWFAVPDLENHHGRGHVRLPGHRTHRNGTRRAVIYRGRPVRQPHRLLRALTRSEASLYSRQIPRSLRRTNAARCNASGVPTSASIFDRASSNFSPDRYRSW
jgi:hypothetical protein